MGLTYTLAPRALRVARTGGARRCRVQYEVHGVAYVSVLCIQVEVGVCIQSRHESRLALSAMTLSLRCVHKRTHSFCMLVPVVSAARKGLMHSIQVAVPNPHTI